MEYLFFQAMFLGSGSRQFKRIELSSGFLQASVLCGVRNGCGSCSSGEIFAFLLVSSGCPGGCVQVSGEPPV